MAGCVNRKRGHVVLLLLPVYNQTGGISIRFVLAKIIIKKNPADYAAPLHGLKRISFVCGLVSNK